MGFHRDFFTIRGQRRRLGRAATAVGIATGLIRGRITAAPSIPRIIGRPLEVAAARPFATALLGTVAVAPRLAVAAVREAVPRAIAGAARFTAARPLAALGIGAGGLIGAGVITTSRRARRAIRDIPARAFGAGEQIGRIIEEPAGTGNGKLRRIIGAGIAGTVIGGAAIAGARALRARRARIPDSITSPLDVDVIAPAVSPVGAVTAIERQEIIGEVRPMPVTTVTRRRRRQTRAPAIQNIIQNQISLDIA